MKNLMNIKKGTNGINLVYALVFVSVILYAVFSALVAIPSPNKSDIPAFSMDKIDRVYKSLSQRKTIEPQPASDFSQVEFGKEEPFR